MKKAGTIILGISIFAGIMAAVAFLETLKDAPLPSNNTTHARPTPLPIDTRPAKDKLLAIVANKPTPGTEGEKIARRQLIGILNSNSTVVSETQNYTLEYLKEADSFMVEIKNPDILLAKSEAIDFLREKGFSSDGICTLPLAFYLAYDISKAPETDRKSFSPIPDFCI